MERKWAISTYLHELNLLTAAQITADTKTARKNFILKPEACVLVPLKNDFIA